MKSIFLIFAAVIACSEGYSFALDRRVLVPVVESVSDEDVVIPVSPQKTVVTNMPLSRERRDVVKVLHSNGKVDLASSSPFEDYLFRKTVTNPDPVETVVVAKRDIRDVVLPDGQTDLAYTSPVEDYEYRKLIAEPRRTAVLV